ncbi:hypothetical protein IW261DRAFT_1604597 [Armillaria novae-zelandiae]|uniref:F-box domain-containing protein n=1 Tax=Armillaria novae-zelandiae TaxID=153914 RepID=A0AA39PML7_9AGAR|nr:hypothetical protein IW261DRAFT_1604597 [Armillaria novae-zelandiae]
MGKGGEPTYSEQEILAMDKGTISALMYHGGLVNAVASADSEDANLIDDYLQKVHGELQRLDAILKEVQEKKIRPQSITDSHSALVSSFRKFPPEVLATIFQHTIAIPPPRDQSPCLPGDITRAYAALCTLDSVCRDWRATVMSTPSLWAHFNIGLRTDRKDECETRVQLLKIIPDRSRDADLIDADFDRPSTLRGLLECLVPTSRRWKSASIGFDDDSEDLYEHIQGRLLLLERLELCSVYSDTVFWEDFRAFEDAPRLRELALGKGLSPVQRFPLPWSQLTCLYINHHITRNDLYAASSSITPNLQFLRLTEQDVEVDSSTWDPDESDVLIPCSEPPHCPLWKKSHLAFSLLKRKTMANEGKTSFYDFLYRSQCPMRKLTIQLGEGLDDFSRIFDQASRLTCLDITLHTVDTAYNLFYTLVTMELLPQLQSLKVVCIVWLTYNEYDDKDLGKILASLFSSRYISLAADILSVHVEVVLGNKAVANPLQPYERTPDGPFLSEPFWEYFETELRDAPELRSRMVTEKKKHCAIMRVKPSHCLMYEATDLSYNIVEYLLCIYKEIHFVGIPKVIFSEVTIKFSSRAEEERISNTYH